MSVAIEPAGVSRRSLLRSGLGFAGAASFGALLPLSRPSAQTADITTTPVADLFLLQGAGCNVAVLPGPDGALMIDGGLPEHADALLEAVREATGNERVQMLVNTHWHDEQTGANQLVGRDGGTIFAHE